MEIETRERNRNEIESDSETETELDINSRCEACPHRDGPAAACHGATGGGALAKTPQSRPLQEAHAIGPRQSQETKKRNDNEYINAKTQKLSAS